MLSSFPRSFSLEEFGKHMVRVDPQAPELQQPLATFSAIPFQPGKPSLVLAHTVKGKGVHFMENQLAWHYKSPDTQQLASALAELEGQP
jgi:transketolase